MWQRSKTASNQEDLGACCAGHAQQRWHMRGFRNFQHPYYVAASCSQWDHCGSLSRDPEVIRAFAWKGTGHTIRNTVHRGRTGLETCAAATLWCLKLVQHEGVLACNLQTLIRMDQQWYVTALMWFSMFGCHDIGCCITTCSDPAQPEMTRARVSHFVPRPSVTGMAGTVSSHYRLISSDRLSALGLM